MNFLPIKIVEKWSYRVNNGMPNVSNPLHIVKLKEILKEDNYPEKFINELINNLTESSFYARSKKSGKIVIYKDKANYQKGIEDGSHEKVDRAEAEKELGIDKKDDEKPVKKDSPKVSKDDGYTGDVAHDLKVDDLKQKEIEKEKNIGNENIDDFRNKDHQDTDSALVYTKTQEQKDKESGTSDFDKGAGTHASRAGEAATHKALRMLKKGSSYDEVKDYLMFIANDKDSFLDKDWVNASISATKSIESTFGIDNIEEVVWDTKSGHKTIGVENHGTSADMFVKTKDGTRVGISLKKDGKVFIRNGGYKSVFGKLSSDLSSAGVSEAELKAFDDKAGMKSFVEDLNQSINEGVDKIKVSQAYPNVVSNLKTDTEYARKALGPNYEKYINRMDDELFDRLQGKSGKMTKDDVKILAKISATPEMMSEDSSIYDNMRNADVRLTQRFLQGIQESKPIESAIKDEVLKGIHVEQIIGTDDSMNLDKFMTVYGIEPDGSQLSERTLMNMFGEDAEKSLKSYRESKSPEDRKKLQKTLRDKLKIDYSDGAKDGTIKIKHEGPPPQEFSLFTIKARSRGIGASPTFEMAQTNFMSNALKFGLDVKEWPEPQKTNFLRKQREE